MERRSVFGLFSQLLLCLVILFGLVIQPVRADEDSPDLRYSSAGGITPGTLLDSDVALAQAAPLPEVATSAEGIGSPTAQLRRVGPSCTYTSLQAAINAASSGDFITVVSATYYENITIGKNLTITGGYSSCTSSGSGTSTLNGGGAAPVITVNDAKVTLVNLNLTNGDGDGAGLRAYVGAQVTLQNSDVYSNNGGQGGGVYIASGAIVTATADSDIRNNTANYGGGLYIRGRFYNADNTSDIYLNEAGSGGGIYALTADVILDSADMYLNEAASTTSGKGGAIYAENSDVYLGDGTQLFGRNTAYDGAGVYADDSTITMVDALLRENLAAHYGGGLYLANGSTLIGDGSIGDGYNAYPNSALKGGGLYVANSAVYFEGDILDNEADSMGAGLYALSSSVVFTDANIGGVGTFGTNVLTGTITYGGGLFLTDSDLSMLRTSISGNTNAATPTAIRGLGLYATNYSVIHMTDSTIEQHDAAGSTTGQAGAIYLDNSDATLDNSTVLSNTSKHNGGAIFLSGSSVLTLTDSLLENNQSTNGQGGAVAIESNGPELIVDGTNFYSNQARSGGAISIGGNTSVTLKNARFGASGRSNRATAGSGGAIIVDAATLDVENCRFMYNQATVDGGAIAVVDATVDIGINASSCNLANTKCSKFNNNAADSDSSLSGYGGALYLDDSILTMDQTWIYANTALSGGGIYQTGNSADSTVRNCLIYGHTVSTGAAGVYNEAGSMFFRNSTLVENGNAYLQQGHSGSFYQSIVWTPYAFGGVTILAGTVSGNCNIDRGGTVGITDDPGFVDDGADDYHLAMRSPALDACTNGRNVDLEGRSRPFGTGYDMGAFESHDVAEYKVFLPMSMKQ